MFIPRLLGLRAKSASTRQDSPGGHGGETGPRRFALSVHLCHFFFIFAEILRWRLARRSWRG